MKKIVVLAICIILAINLIFMPAFLSKSVDISKGTEAKTVLKLWHCDTVPGGKNSRATVLKDIAYEFHQRDKDVYIIVSVYSYEEMLSELKKGKSPDLISFGNGCEEILPYLREYNGNVAFLPELESAVLVNGKIMAVPWCYGRYWQIDGEKGFSYSYDTAIPFAFSQNAEGTGQNGGQLFQNTLEECYDTFIKEGQGFIATNRELSKILTRVDNNKMNMPEIAVISDYSDLVNAIGVCAGTENPNECETFLGFLQSEKAQSKVARLNLFSAVGYKLYSGITLGRFEDLEVKTHFESVFLSDSKKADGISLAKKVISGEVSLDEFRKQIADIG